MTWTRSDEELALALLALDTTTPMETGCPGELRAAQELYADAAATLGFTTVHFGPARPESVTDPRAPATVRLAARRMGLEFLRCQPNLVLSLGDAPPERTIMFNFHLDTVSGIQPAGVRDGLLHGRGAVDDKGPGVALLAGIRQALPLRPGVRILIQAVGGEEGGAMGVYGTRELASLGFVGRLNVVAEPTRGGFLDRSTAAMTVRLTADGAGSTDDEPERGENATVLLGFLAAWFAREVVPRVTDLGGKACVAGLHVGDAHNRVYGTGDLLCNFAYRDEAAARAIDGLVTRAVDAALTAFTEEFGGHPATAVTAAAARRMLRVTWDKRGLPTLDNRDPAMEKLLGAAGFRRHDDDAGALRPFTCDAIWLGGTGGHTVIAGPGDLAANNAHAAGEHVAITELDEYARRISTLVTGFADWCERTSARTTTSRGGVMS
ncbi:M20/M25/M40 family metallo-hydrolase [Lentzea kentuckyensis]|uniref:M20/M25/M40 family metallo-hydrolase n=1 Tax=Lentzea kentuckyensis TaxID=360086 RepID=UPI001FE86A00|nr:M20/M25/M40 family metallo-hydrolase [Lentzea kentuckyensis]